MRKLQKIIYHIESYFIKQLSYFNENLYTTRYKTYLKKIGVDVRGSGPIFIEKSAYFDGTDYKKIHLGEKVVISRNVTILTHDLSLQRAFYHLGFEKNHLCGYIEDIVIGNNSFIGANAMLLPGTIIGENCIVGAGAVVKGKYPDNSIIVGNPARIVANTEEWGQKKFNEKKYTKIY